MDRRTSPIHSLCHYAAQMAQRMASCHFIAHYRRFNAYSNAWCALRNN